MKGRSGLAVVVAAAVGLLAAYLSVIRPWQLRWGATDEEVKRRMPGDEVVEKPTFNATRAVTVNAFPGDIWPWILQIGIGRAGWYSYDWIDNLRVPSAKRIIPELQQVEVGDLIPMSPDGQAGVLGKGVRARSLVVVVGQEGGCHMALDVGAYR